MSHGYILLYVIYMVIHFIFHSLERATRITRLKAEL